MERLIEHLVEHRTKVFVIVRWVSLIMVVAGYAILLFLLLPEYL